MKKLRILIGTVLLSAGLAGCTSAYYASAGYASDDLYAVHDKTQIARRKLAEAEAQRAAAEARRAEWEAKIAEAEAAAAENNYYEYQAADANPYQSVLADDYESAYARRLRGFESPNYKMPSSYLDARYSSAFSYASAYDPAFYNIVISGDQVWVEPKYITSMFGSWGTVIYGDPWYWGWNRPWGPSFSIGSWGWSFGWNSWYNPWYGPWGPWYSSWYDPWYHPGWGWGPGWHGGHHYHPGPGWGGHGRPYHSNIVRRPNPYTSPSGTRYGVGSRFGSPSSGSLRGSGSNRRNNFGVRSNNSGGSSRSRYDSGSPSRGSRYDDTYRNSGGSTYNRGGSYNSGSSSPYSRGGSSSGSSGGGSRGGSGTTSSGGSYRNSGGR